MIAREGYFTIAFVMVVSLLIVWGASVLPAPYAITLQLAALLTFLLVIYFFRDPDRRVPDLPNLILAPADGKVVLIRQTEEKSYLNSRVTQISIFLSPLDVHVNRLPISGRLEHLEYFPGTYKMAWEEEASELNERAHFGVIHQSGYRMMFKQITGFLARRIVYRIKIGDQLQAGHRFGIMKFGSRMDLLLPEGADIQVKEGDRTVAGESIIGVINP